MPKAVKMLFVDTLGVDSMSALEEEVKMSLDCFFCFEEGDEGIWMFVLTEVVVENSSVNCVCWLGRTVSFAFLGIDESFWMAGFMGQPWNMVTHQLLPPTNY